MFPLDIFKIVGDSALIHNLGNFQVRLVAKIDPDLFRQFDLFFAGQSFRLFRHFRNHQFPIEFFPNALQPTKLPPLLRS